MSPALTAPDSRCKTLGMADDSSSTGASGPPTTSAHPRRPSGRSNSPGAEVLREVARRAFVASGFHAVSIRELAREAGLSLSALYHHYASKQDLLYGMLNDAIDEFHAILGERMNTLSPDADPAERLKVLVKSTVEYRAQMPEESLLFLRELRNLDPPFAEPLIRRRDEVGDLFTQAIDDGVRCGLFTTPYPQDARRAVLAILNAIPSWYRVSGEISVDMLVCRYQRLSLTIVEYRGDLDDLA